MNAREAMNAEDREWSSEMAGETPTGPRGGTTTVTKSGMVKKNLWIPQDEAEMLREKAFHERRSEADIIREGLRTVLEEPAAAAG
jgi:hypothetical protein